MSSIRYFLKQKHYRLCCIILDANIYIKDVRVLGVCLVMEGLTNIVFNPHAL